MELINKINNGEAKIGVIGLGYVGLPLAIEFARNNFEVVGFDTDESKIPMLLNGKSYIKHIYSKKIQLVINNNKFQPTADFKRLGEVDAIIICVPTPLNEHSEPDLTYVQNTARQISFYLRKEQLVVLESTTYPGTTEELLLPILENAPLVQAKKMQPQVDAAPEKFKVGKDFFLAFSPEREDPNNPEFNTANTPKVVGGVTEKCLQAALALYDKIIVRTVPVSSPKVAEAAKLLENIYRSVNIALVNELKMVFDKMGIDVWEVIEAAKTKPFGFTPFYPGPGLGGHCIPIDPFYLSWKAKEFDISTKFIELAGEINTTQPYYVVDRAIKILNDNVKSINSSKILLLGAAYKKNIDDLRESPALKLIDILQSHHAAVDYNDPFIPALPKTRKYNYKMTSTELTGINISSYDLVILVTDHDEYDYKKIAQHARLILDTRNVFAKNNILQKNIFKA